MWLALTTENVTTCESSWRRYTPHAASRSILRAAAAVVVVGRPIRLGARQDRSPGVIDHALAGFEGPVPVQRLSFALLLSSHWSRSPITSQTFPHSLQLRLSVIRSTQAPLHAVRGGSQVTSPSPSPDSPSPSPSPSPFPSPSPSPSPSPGSPSPSWSPYHFHRCGVRRCNPTQAGPSRQPKDFDYATSWCDGSTMLSVSTRKRLARPLRRDRAARSSHSSTRPPWPCGRRTRCSNNEACRRPQCES